MLPSVCKTSGFLVALSIQGYADLEYKQKLILKQQYFRVAFAYY
jgi:hypothetical protein